jgi:hypothetical protein
MKQDTTMELMEDIMTDMANENIPMTTKAIDSIVRMLINQGSQSDALDWIQEMFTQKLVRPSCGVFLQLLDVSLKKRDEFEARRVVTVIEQLFTEIERMESTVDGTNTRSLNISSLDKLSDKATDETFVEHSLGLFRKNCRRIAERSTITKTKTAEPNAI